MATSVKTEHIKHDHCPDMMPSIMSMILSNWRVRKATI